MAGELETLLSEWSARREISASQRDSDGKHYLVFDGAHEVALSQLGNSIFLESDLTPLPGRRDEAEKLLERLMKFQLAQARSGDDVLSVTEAGDTVTMFRVMRADRLDLNTFENGLGGFVNAIAFMASHVAPSERPALRPQPMAEQVFIP